MNQANLAQKIRTLEEDVAELKQYLVFDVKKDPDLKNWGKLRKLSRQVRQELFRERYPELYAKLKKK